MSTANLTPDRYRLGITNYTDDGYLKNGTSTIGGYSSRIAYVWEILINPDYSSIPAGSTVSSVTIDVTVSANNNPGASTIKVHAQNQGTWTDNGTDPRYTTFDNPAGSPSLWPTELSSVSLAGSATGTQTIPTASALVTHIQSYVDGTYPDSTYKGLVITNYTDYYGYYATITSVAMTIEYTGGGTTRRRIIIM